MDAQTWGLLANAGVWIGIGAYLAFLAARQRTLAARLSRMEMLDHD